MLVQLYYQAKFILLSFCLIVLLALTGLISVRETAAQNIHYGFLTELQTQIRHVITNVGCSVVSVTAQKRQLTQGNGQMWFESIGSGIVVDSRGYVLTNNHVVRDGENIKVSFWQYGSKKIYSAIVADVSPDSDLALLKIEEIVSLTPVLLGDSNSLTRGDWAVCVGSPYGFEHSVTLGIVSGLHRDLNIEGVTYRDMIQTDATINQGNSGGALLTLQGKVAGISVAMFSPDKAYTGLGFAIPVNRARQFISGILGAIPIVRRQLSQSLFQLQSKFQLTPKLTPIISNSATTVTAIETPLVIPDKKESVDLSQPMPRDKKHAQCFDCTVCHTIKKKLVANMNKPMPHLPVGKCNICHIMIQEPIADGPTTVAWKTLVDKITINSLNRTEWFLLVTIFATAFLSIICGIDGGLLFVSALLFFDYELKLAIAASLLLVAATGSFAFLQIKGIRHVNLYSLGTVVLSVLLAAVGGAIATAFLTSGFILTLLVGSLLLAGLFMLYGRNDKRYKDYILTTISYSDCSDLEFWAWRVQYNGKSYILALWPFIILVILAAFVGSLLGNGGSWLLVPLCLAISRIPLVVTIVVSGVVSPLVGLAGFLVYNLIESATPPLLWPLCLAAICGALFGLYFIQIRYKSLTRILASLILCLIGLLMLIYSPSTL